MDFLANFLQNQQQPQAVSQENVENVATALEQPVQDVGGFIPLPEIENREMLAKSLLQTANDRNVHPLARGLSAFFGTKQLNDLSSERAKTEQGLQAIEQQRQEKALQDKRLYEQQQQATQFDRQKELQDDKLASQRQARQEDIAFRREQANIDRAREDRLLSIQQREKAFAREAKQLEADLKEGKAADKEVFDRSSKLRSEFTKLSGEFIKQRDAYGRIQASAEEPSAAGDLALIFNYMKLLDPGSVVREGEFATAQNAAGIDERLRAQYNKVISGQRLTKDTRTDFLNRSQKIYDKSQDQQQKRIDNYRSLAEKVGADPEQVLVDFGLAEEEAQNAEVQTEEGAMSAAPSSGGFKFLGFE